MTSFSSLELHGTQYSTFICWSYLYENVRVDLVCRNGIFPMDKKQVFFCNFYFLCCCSTHLFLLVFFFFAFSFFISIVFLGLAVDWSCSGCYLALSRLYRLTVAERNDLQAAHSKEILSSFQQIYLFVYFNILAGPAPQRPQWKTLQQVHWI